MTEMAKMVGGPLHGQLLKVAGKRRLIVPTLYNSRLPKQELRKGYLFYECEYRRVRRGLYRFCAGYYYDPTFPKRAR